MIEIEARSRIAQAHREAFATEEQDELAVGEIVRLHDGDLVARIHNGPDHEKKRALGSRRDDRAILCRDRSASEGRELFGYIGPQRAGATVFRIGLAAADADGIRETRERVRGGRKSVDIAMREIDRASGQRGSPH